MVEITEEALEELNVKANKYDETLEELNATVEKYDVLVQAIRDLQLEISLWDHTLVLFGSPISLWNSFQQYLANLIEEDQNVVG